MYLSSDVYIITDQGFRSISQLTASYAVGRPYPRALSYNPTDYDPCLTFANISYIEPSDEEVMLYDVVFIENPTSRTIFTTCSGDTEFLKYNIVSTTVEPIQNRSYNVYSYILNNNKEDSSNKVEPQWEQLAKMTNFGVAMPFLGFSDTIIQYQEKKSVIPDRAYKILGEDGECLPVFTTKSILSTNFILTR